MQNESTHGHIFIAFGQIEIEPIIHFVYLEPRREYKLAIRGFLSNVFRIVMFIFNFAENFFNDVFQRDNSARSTKLIDNNAKAFLLLQKCLH